MLSVALGLVEFDPAAMKAFYGIDALRFVAPVRIGDTLHVETEVLDVRPRDADGVVTSRFVVVTHEGTEVLVATLKCLVAREAAA